jgi:polysaccharide export outer membrane protein
MRTAATAPVAASLPGGVPVGTPSPATQPALMLQPVPRAAAPREPAIIASSWQPVQHLEVSPAGPEAGNPAALPGLGPVLPAAPMPGYAAGPAVMSGPYTAAPRGPRIQRLASGDPPAAVESGPLVLPTPRVMPVEPGLPPGVVAGHDGLAPPPGELYYSGHHGPFPAPPVPKEFRKQALPSYVVEPPDILLIQATTAISSPLQPIQGLHLVRPDGTVSLGIHGTLFVAGLTVEQIKNAIAVQLQSGLGEQSPAKKLSLEKIKSELDVDVYAFNSKFYYIITDGGGYGAQVFRLPITGNETVLDALAQVNGLPPVASKKKIWVARATPGDAEHPKILPVDWCGLTERGSAATNYQIYPNDRIFVQSDALIRTDTLLAKFLSPIQRVFGATLLGATTVNTIKNGSGVGSNTGTR